MKILVFDLVGRYAHFKKVYSNSSSLSYFIPPRTTINGIIAAILGLERDTYYDDFNLEKVNIAVKVNNPLRKMMQTINYIFYKSQVDLVKRTHPTQVPFEAVLGQDGNISYRIYVNMKDDVKFNKLIDLIKNNKAQYIPSLGVLTFMCSTKYVGVFDAAPSNTEDYLEISSAINMDNFIQESLKINENMHIVKEQMPRNFHSNRVPDKLYDYLFDYYGNKITLKINCDYYSINGENIIFM